MQKDIKYCVVIPTLNRADLLLPALMYYVVNMPTTKIIIYENGPQSIYPLLTMLRDYWWAAKNEQMLSALLNIKVIRSWNSKNIGVAAAWNALLEEAFKEHTHALVLNDDIYLNRTQEEMSLLIHDPELGNKIYVCEKAYDWCAFLISDEVFAKVGEFDTDLSIYYNDNDMMRRMKLMGIEVAQVPFLNPNVFNRSSSLLRDPSLQPLIEENKQFYIKKWGGLPGAETYEVPFNATN